MWMSVRSARLVAQALQLERSNAPVERLDDQRRPAARWERGAERPHDALRVLALDRAVDTRRRRLPHAQMPNVANAPDQRRNGRQPVLHLSLPLTFGWSGSNCILLCRKIRFFDWRDGDDSCIPDHPWWIAAACSRSADPAPPATPPVAGLNPAAFDSNVRPQDDLFLHVNGAWLAKTEIPADKAWYGAFDILFDKAQADLRNIVEEAAKSTSKTPGSEAQKIGDFYDSFMNEARIEELAITRLNAELAAIDALKTRSVVARHFGHFFKLNLISPMIGYVDGDAQQPTDDILYVYQGGLGLPDRDYDLENDPKLKEYREQVRGAPCHAPDVRERSRRPEKSAAAIFALETRLARAHWTNVENRDAVKTYNKVTVADLGEAVPGFRLGGVDPPSSA